jgi:hypothetical protein
VLTVVTNGPVAGWIGLAFFVPCTGIFTFNLFKPPRLTLTIEGFRFSHLWRLGPLFEWPLVHGFHPWSSGLGTTLIAFTYDGEARRWHGLLAQANRSLTHGNAALPSTYGRRPQELADLLERWRLAHAAGSPQGGEQNQQADPEASSERQPSTSASPVANHTGGVWHVIDNQSPPTFKPYYVARCTCDWVGFPRTGRRAEERARKDALTHTPDITPGLRRPVG